MATTNWKSRYERERAARKEAERILEDRSSSLMDANQSMIQEYQSLEEIVSERTIALEAAIRTLKKEIAGRKLIEKELVIARDEAIRNDELKSQFLARVSHDIRTPLNSIVGYTSLMQQEELSPQQLKHLDSIESSTSVLLRVINDLLDISKIDANKMELKFAQCSVEKLIKNTLSLVTPLTEKKDLTLTINSQFNIPDQIMLDSSRFQQVLINLLTNAIKFTTEGSVTVNIRFSQNNVVTLPNALSKTHSFRESDIGKLTIAVKDTGVGMNQEMLRAVFDPYVQIGNMANKDDIGCGLGLAICKKLVTLMGGKISVKSTEKEGSTFSFWIPCAIKNNIDVKTEHDHYELDASDTELNKIARDTSPTLSSFENMALEKPLSILIADDFEANRLVLQAQLQVLGYPADMVANGEEVLHALRAREYDVILMDIRMPVLDGMQATKYIRKNQDIAQPYIIAVTASAVSGDREKFISYGINDYISKPVYPNALAVALGKAFNHCKGESFTENSSVDTATIEQPPVELALDELYARIGPATDQLLKKVFPIFIRELPHRQQRMLDYFQNQQIESFREVCHGLKGSSRSVGAAQLGDLCEKFEMQASAGQFPTREELDSLIRKAQSTKTALSQKLSELNE